MALFGGGKKTTDTKNDTISSKENPPLDYVGKHRKPITPIVDNPVLTPAQADQLQRDIALFDK